MIELVPVEPPIAGGWHDRVRLALARCDFLPGHPHKRFARNVADAQLDRITESQWRYVMTLAWRYRRQMPPVLVPPHAAVKALPKWLPRAPKQLRKAQPNPAQADIETYLADCDAREGRTHP